MKKWNYFAVFLLLGIIYANRITILTILFPIDFYNELSITFTQDILSGIGLSIPMLTPILFMAFFLKWHYQKPTIETLKLLKNGITKTNLILWVTFLIISTSAISLHIFAPLRESKQELQLLAIFTAIFIFLIYWTLNLLANYLNDPRIKNQKNWTVILHYFLIYPLATGFILFFLPITFSF